MPIIVEDMMIMRRPTGDDTAISFSVGGDPPVQKRHKIAWKGILGGWKESSRRIPIIYDPSSKEKKQLAAAVKAALQDLEVGGFPFFTNPDTKLTLELTFFFADRPAQPFPKKKDINNLVKFVMDAMNGILYCDDRAIVRVTAEKTFATEASSSVIIRNYE